MAINTKRFKSIVLGTLVSSAFLLSCGEPKEEETDTNDDLRTYLPGGNSGQSSGQSTAALPNVSSINLSGLGAAQSTDGAALTTSEE